MFTGIVQAVGRIVAVDAGAERARLVVDAGALDCADVAIGDSIAVAGCCLTVVERGARRAALRASRSTCRPRRSRCTTGSPRRARSTSRSRCASPIASAVT